jgi:hypothetical protein
VAEQKRRKSSFRTNGAVPQFGDVETEQVLEK